MTNTQACCEGENFQQPSVPREYWIAGLSLASGVALGALGMYLYDPNRGKARRTKLQEKAFRTVRRTRQDLAGKAEDLLHRTKGVIARAGASVARSDAVDDDVLAGRVRSHLGHFTHHAHAIKTEVKEGIVTLNGILPERERQRLVTEVASIAGVKEVRDQLACEVPV